MKKVNITKEKTMAFAIRIVNLYKHLKSNKSEFVMSKQLLKSGTSIGANAREANHAESAADFIHKLSISQKKLVKQCIGWNYFIPLSLFQKLNSHQFTKTVMNFMP